jgi:hypothetical protein
MISWEHVAEFIMQMTLRRRLSSRTQLERFRELSATFDYICESFETGDQRTGSKTGRYAWEHWRKEIRDSFRGGVPLGFLGNPVISRTMVFCRRRGVQETSSKVRNIVNVLGPDTSSRLLREDYVGLPTIANARFMTSANRAHHANHLASYCHNIGKHFWNQDSIGEWGGGYGDMARLIRRMNPSATYTIIDVPEMLALQYVYLATLEGPGELNISSSDRPLLQGKINLVSSARVVKDPIQCDCFISTWALTESPEEHQVFVASKKFFGAKHLLLASTLNEDNCLVHVIPNDVVRIPIARSKSIGPGNEYWFS